MFGLLWESVISNLLYFALHLSNAGSFPAPLSAEKEQEYLKKMQDGDEDAEHLLIEHNLRLVAHIIKKYYSSYGEQEDLISIGTIGLIKAVKTFKPDKGTRLATYAARCIENTILSPTRLYTPIKYPVALKTSAGEYCLGFQRTITLCVEQMIILYGTHRFVYIVFA